MISQNLGRNEDINRNIKSQGFIITNPKQEVMRGVTWLRIQNRGWHRTYYHRQELHDLGFTFDSKSTDWIKQATEGGLEQAQAFCKKHRLRLFIDYPQFRRNSTYRKTFFESHPGLYGRDFYFCSYYGRLLCKSKITVDHLFAVKAVQKSAFLKWLFRELR